jgi:hypothetical protein
MDGVDFPVTMGAAWRTLDKLEGPTKKSSPIALEGIPELDMPIDTFTLAGCCPEPTFRTEKLKL